MIDKNLFKNICLHITILPTNRGTCAPQNYILSYIAKKLPENPAAWER